VHVRRVRLSSSCPRAAREADAVTDDLNVNASVARAEDTWFSRDLPVLVAIVTLFDRAGFGFITYQQVADRTGLSGDVVSQSLRALRGGNYIESPPAGGSDLSQHLVTGVSAGARVVTGQWPSDHTVVERLLAALEEESRLAPTEEKREKLRRLRQTMIEAGTQLVAKIIGEVVGPHLPQG
jgi:DNA-binding transcriptional ArsR family regulator